ncbi:hypothetical protein [Acidisoma sp. S159]|uniref:hypothetical protein n=1 Tax=Acidisoma sp. S159 TaxID=1747225 RepID=UPI00131C0109|nr:hypothetical protein [Acidisoma sp. S159]
MSASLTRRLEALEAKVPGAVLPQVFVWRPLGMSPSEESAWEADLAARKAASPRQNFMIFSWGDPQ